MSLPHGLRGHVAYAEASDWLAEQSKKAATAAAAAAAAAEAAGEEEPAAAAGKKRKSAAGAPGAVALPALAELFSIGQLVRCTVTGLRDGSSDDNGSAGKKRADGKEGASGGKKKRVDVSLRVSKMNGGLGAPPCSSCCPAAGCTHCQDWNAT